MICIKVYKVEFKGEGVAVLAPRAGIAGVAKR